MFEVLPSSLTRFFHFVNEAKIHDYILRQLFFLCDYFRARMRYLKSTSLLLAEEANMGQVKEMIIDFHHKSLDKWPVWLRILAPREQWP